MAGTIASGAAEGASQAAVRENPLAYYVGSMLASGPGELPRALQVEILRRAVLEAALSFPNANFHQWARHYLDSPQEEVDLPPMIKRKRAGR